MADAHWKKHKSERTHVMRRFIDFWSTILLVSSQICAPKVYEAGSVEQLPEVAEKMREYFAAIAKKVQDRQNTLKESMEDLHAKVEQMKNQKKSDQQTLIKKRRERNTQKNEKRRLKEKFETAQADLRLVYPSLFCNAHTD